MKYFFLSFLLSFSVLAGPIVVMDTNFGKIEIELDDKKAPVTVNNFLTYVDARFYDGTIFHRVIDNFMIQGGGFLPGMKEKANKGKSITNEADNGLKNDNATIAMARTSDPHSASAQFFINVADNEFLNHKSKTEAGWGYAVFGKVISGMHVVNRIKKVKTGNMAGHANVPMDEVLIKSVRRK